MRAPLFAAILGCACVASAERLITIPTAHKIPYRQLKYELRYKPGSDGRFENYLGLGATTAIELELRAQNLDQRNQIGTFDLTYNVISPITDFTPGIAFGIQDALNRSPEGSRFFAAVTFRQGFYAIGGEAPSDVTLGISALNRRLYPFVGASIPFSQEFMVQAEHDGMRLSVALELRPQKNLGIKWIFREGSSLVGFEYQHRF